MVSEISCYLVKDDGLDHGCGKHEDGDGVAEEGSGTSQDACTFLVLVFRYVREEGAQEEGLEECQAVLDELEKTSKEIGTAIRDEKGSP